jgi:hypothetical protein
MTRDQGPETIEPVVGSRMWRHPALQAVFLVGALLAAAIFGIMSRQFLDLETRATITARDDASEFSRRSAHEIQSQLHGIMPLVQGVADDLGSGVIDSANLPRRFDITLEITPRLFGIGAAYEPAEDVKPFAPFLVRRKGRPPYLFQIEQELDYTEFQEQWYLEPLLNGARWSEPYAGKGQPEPVVDYAVPFYRPGRDPASDAPSGIVFATVALESVEEILENLGASVSGYQYILSEQGRFITHPRKELVRAGGTIFELAWETGDTALFETAIRATKGERGLISHVDPVTGEEAFVVYEPISELGWSIVTVALKGQSADADYHRRIYMKLLLAALMAVLLMALFILGFMRWKIGREWTYATVVALTFLVGTPLIWKIEYEYPAADTDQSEEIVNQTSLRRFIDNYTKESERLKADVPTYVPTGMFIQSIEFTNANDVKITGYIWQKYKRGVHDDVSRGFVLPEAEAPIVKVVYNRPLVDDGAADGLLSNISLSFKKDDCTKHKTSDLGFGPKGCSQLIGWYFSTSVRQNFTYGAYPFDDQYVWLRLWHKDFDRNVVLVPDLASYKVTEPSALPGIETDFVLPGWSLRDSVFTYRRHQYNTNFGIDDYVGQDAFPELYFNVHIKREFLGPFVLHFLPQFVVAMMLFIILLMGSKEGEKAKWLGFAAKDIVRGSSVLIIVLIFAHSSLRRTIDSASLVYLEYFYMILYISSLLIAFNSVLFATGGFKIVEYKDNLLPKIFFWPILSVTVFAITALSFY